MENGSWLQVETLTLEFCKT